MSQWMKHSKARISCRVNPSPAGEGHRVWAKTILLIITLLALILAACSGSSDSGDTLQATATPIPTSPASSRPTYTVERGTVENTLAFTGRWLPRDQVELAFEISGTIRNVNVRTGDAVTAGDLLADFQIRDLENQLVTARLNLEAAERNLNESDGGAQSIVDAQFSLADANINLTSTVNNAPWTSLESARLQLDQAQRQLEDAQRSYDNTISDPSNPASAIDSAYQSLRQAEEGLLAAENSYFSAAQSYNQHQYSVQSAENSVAQREMQLEDATDGSGVDPSLIQAVQEAQISVNNIEADIALATLYAPFDGVILEVTISPGDSASAFVAVITLAIPEPSEIIANLAFNDTQNMNVNMLGVCQEVNRPESAVQCAVRQIPLTSNDVDQSTRIAAQLNHLTLGSLVEVTLPLEVREDVLWLPPQALRTFQSRTFVVLQTPDGEQISDVVLGLQTDERVEIISGVSEGDIVVAQ